MTKELSRDSAQEIGPRGDVVKCASESARPGGIIYSRAILLLAYNLTVKLSASFRALPHSYFWSLRVQVHGDSPPTGVIAWLFFHVFCAKVPGG